MIAVQTPDAVLPAPTKPRLRGRSVRRAIPTPCRPRPVERCPARIARLLAPPGRARPRRGRRLWGLVGSAAAHAAVLGLACLGVVERQPPPRIINSVGQATPALQLRFVPSKETVDPPLDPPRVHQRPLVHEAHTPDVPMATHVPPLPSAPVPAAMPRAPERPDRVAALQEPLPPHPHIQRRAQPESHTGPRVPPPAAQEDVPVSSLHKQGVRTAAHIRRVPVPDYPQTSRQRGEQGTVFVEVTVGPDGRAHAVRLVRASPFLRLNRAALAAARRARFSPARSNGAPVAATVTIPFRFVLQ